MNVKQLELKRLREGLDSVRHARHVVQAIRKPLAQAMRLQHAADVRLRKSNAAFERLTEQQLLSDDFTEGLGLDFPSLRDQLTQLSKDLGTEDKRLAKRIERLQQDRRLTSSAIELRKVRKRLEKARERKAETAAARKNLLKLELLERVRTAAQKEDNPRALEYLDNMATFIQTGGKTGDYGLSLAGLRHVGRKDLADTLSAAFSKYLARSK